MFKGIEEQTKKFANELNQRPRCFAFSFADLELVDRYQKDNHERKKCRLLSEELSQKLHQIYSRGKTGYIPPIKFIDFGLLEKEDYGIFPNVNSCFFWNYDRWIKLGKNFLRENATISANGILTLNSSAGQEITSFGYLHVNNREKFSEKKNFLQTKSQRRKGQKRKGATRTKRASGKTTIRSPSPTTRSRI